MVSGSLCPAWNNQLKELNESRAEASKGQCPVGHKVKGEFLDVRAHLKADLIAWSAGI